MAVYEQLLVEKDGHIAIVSLNLPEKLNPLTLTMRNSLKQAADDLQKDDDVRAIVLTGAGRGFRSGADVGNQGKRISNTAAGTTP